jgi:hypothetical protein
VPESVTTCVLAFVVVPNSVTTPVRSGAVVTDSVTQGLAVVTDSATTPEWCDRLCNNTRETLQNAAFSVRPPNWDKLWRNVSCPLYGAPSTLYGMVDGFGSGGVGCGVFLVPNRSKMMFLGPGGGPGESRNSPVGFERRSAECVKSVNLDREHIQQKPPPDVGTVHRPETVTAGERYRWLIAGGGWGWRSPSGIPEFDCRPLRVPFRHARNECQRFRENSSEDYRERVDS